MTIVRNVLGTTIGLQSLAVMNKAVKLIPKDLSKSKSKAKKINPERFVRGFTDILVGTTLIKPTASMVGKL